VGDRSADSFRQFFERFKGLKEAVFYTDNWEAYSEVIPADQHVIGKRHTIGIEQNNSNIRHFLGRMTRRTKVVSKSAEMVMASLHISWYVNENNGFSELQKIFMSIF